MDDDAIKVAIAAAAANRFVLLQRTISIAFVTLLGFWYAARRFSELETVIKPQANQHFLLQMLATLPDSPNIAVWSFNMVNTLFERSTQ